MMHTAPIAPRAPAIVAVVGLLVALWRRTLQRRPRRVAVRVAEAAP